MKLSLYKSLLTNKRTMVVASQGRCGYEGYVEYQISFYKGQWHAVKTNGYGVDFVGIYPGSKRLRGVLNLIWGL